MPFSFLRLFRSLAGFLGTLMACSAARAQIYEHVTTPGLEEGLIYQLAAAPRSQKPAFERQEFSFPNVPDVGTQDFSVCFVVEFHMLSSHGLASGGFSKSSDATGFGWWVNINTDVDAHFHSQALKDAVTLRAPFDELGDSLHHVAVVIKRDARQPLSGLWIDGVERVSMAVPPVDFSCPGKPLRLSVDELTPHFRDVRIYNRALTRPEILELCLRGGRRGQAPASDGPKPFPKHPAPPANGPRFIPQPDETIALIGGTEAVALAESGDLEALLLTAFPQTRFHFRSLAWEGDTVFKQDRPMNFGPLEQQLRRVNAGAVFMMFGRQECLDANDEGGKDEELMKFKTAFETLLTDVKKVTSNIVVIGPPPFEKKQPPLPDVSRKNESLKGYNRVLEEAAAANQAVYLDADSKSWGHHTDKGFEPTEDGVTLTWVGRCYVRMAIEKDLGLSRTEGAAFDEKTGLAFRNLLRTKNRLWHDYWRPSNWAFLYGDRTNQPSSRDPVNAQIRLFPSELEQYPPLIKDAEEKVFRALDAATKKLP